MAKRRYEKKPNRLQQLRVLGFDLSTTVPFTSQVRPRCSRCEVKVINNTPCHETGCPNQTFECRGCNARVKRRNSYCADCRH